MKIIPIGKIGEDLLTEVCEEIRSNFNLPTQTLKPIQIPKNEETYNFFRQQYIGPGVIKFLSRNYSGRVLGIMDEDLYSDELNFIFGQAEFEGRVAIVSIYRLDPKFYRKEEPGKLVERAVKECLHELGHLFGLEHCSNQKCVMSFSNTVWDVDRKSKEFCERCRQKLLAKI
mgnify:CR=1 FL=1